MKLFLKASSLIEIYLFNSFICDPQKLVIYTLNFNNETLRNNKMHVSSLLRLFPSQLPPRSAVKNKSLSIQFNFEDEKSTNWKIYNNIIYFFGNKTL